MENYSDSVASTARPLTLPHEAVRVRTMCASYGLDPRFKDNDAILASDQELIDSLRTWAEHNDGATLLPTGKNLRNLKPIIRDVDGRRELELGWWGYLVNGAPAKFPSINTRAERLMERQGQSPSRAIVPATAWFEMQKPARQWFRFGTDTNQLFALAAVTQAGRTSDGAEFTCYSIVMGPASDELAHVHDRTPVLIPANFVSEWLTSDAPSRDLIDDALTESEGALKDIIPAPVEARP
jgi:putative SOS response-associated peptidase YedK